MRTLYNIINSTTLYVSTLKQLSFETELHNAVIPVFYPAQT